MKLIRLPYASEMHIYLDESGVFANPRNLDNVVSAVCALIVPSGRNLQMLDAFRSLKSDWADPDSELKWAQLTEGQIAQIASLLRRYDVLVEVCAIDMGFHPESLVAQKKTLQAEMILGEIDSRYSKAATHITRWFATQVGRMSNPLFVQSELMIRCVEDTIRDGTLYYCQRMPTELGHFHWILDAKDRRITRFEKLWSAIIASALESRFLQNPLVTLEEGDYEHFDRRFLKEYRKLPERLVGRIAEPRTPFKTHDIQAIIRESLAFTDSASNLGIQLAHALVNAITRAFNRNLKPEGYGEIGSLMVRKPKHTVRMVAFDPGGKTGGRTRTVTVPYLDVIRAFESTAKPMVCEDLLTGD
ncbi:DUF3800 domain-containing protein [Candidatus Eisenbacteria bacterium]|uniref:DUF3800 domain-containing protein n=1 Tax=Eiseniibacteriota bacterium TaxID=2212470 RepID=A0ABV6YN56_UNCEI